MQLATLGTNTGDSKGGTANIQRLRVFIETKIQEIVWEGKSFELNEITSDLCDMIEPEVNHALEEMVAHSRSIMEGFLQDKLKEFDVLCEGALCSIAKKTTIGVGSIGDTRLDDIRKALDGAKEFVKRLDAGFAFAEKLVSTIEKSVGTVLVLVETVTQMMKVFATTLKRLAKTGENIPDNVKGIRSRFEEEMKNLELAHLASDMETASGFDAAQSTGKALSKVAEILNGVNRSIIALSQVQAVLETMLDVVGKAKSLQQDAKRILSSGDGLVRGLSSLLEELKQTRTFNIDAAKGDELLKIGKVLSDFARTEVSTLVIRLLASSKMFSTSMMIFKCSPPIDITFSNDAQCPDTALPGTITVQATGEMHQEKPVYMSTGDADSG